MRQLDWLHMKYQQLTATVRGAIKVLLHGQYSVREIAVKVGANPSTVSREIRKRSTPTGYHAQTAQAHYQRNRQRCRMKKKLAHSQRHIAEYLSFSAKLLNSFMLSPVST